VGRVAEARAERVEWEQAGVVPASGRLEALSRARAGYFVNESTGHLVSGGEVVAEYTGRTCRVGDSLFRYHRLKRGRWTRDGDDEAVVQVGAWTRAVDKGAIVKHSSGVLSVAGMEFAVRVSLPGNLCFSVVELRSDQDTAVVTARRLPPPRRRRGWIAVAEALLAEADLPHPELLGLLCFRLFHFEDGAVSTRWPRDLRGS
jgi:hypothetical protein